MSDQVLNKRCTMCKEFYPATLEYFSAHTQTKDKLRSSCRKCENVRSKERHERDRSKILQRQKQEYHRDIEASRKYNREKAKRYRERDPETSNQRSREWAKNNPEKRRATERRWRATNPDRLKEQTARRRARRAANPDLYRKIDRDRYARNPETKKRNVKAWRHRNPAKVGIIDLRKRTRKKQLPSEFTAQDWQRCLEYFGHRCAVCGRPAGFWHVLAKDHWIPLNDPHPDNPGTVPWNIVPLCHAMEDGQGGCNNSKKDKKPIEWLVSVYGQTKAAIIAAQVQAYFDLVRKY